MFWLAIAPTSAEKQAFKSRIQVVMFKLLLTTLMTGSHMWSSYMALVYVYCLFDPHALPSDEEDITIAMARISLMYSYQP